MITQIETIADFNALPSYLQTAVQSVDAKSNPHGFRRTAHRLCAERKIKIQNAVVKAVEENAISVSLAISILEQNMAYGRDGKSMMRKFLDK